MRYMGGKAKLGKKIAPYIQERLGDRLYVEPFCGALNIARNVKASRMLLNDLCPCLTDLFSLVERREFEFPVHVSAEEYKVLLVQANAGNHTPMSTFVGFGCSFGGKFFGGYVWPSPTNAVGCPKKGLLSKMADLSSVQITWSAVSYDALVLEEPSLIYCDPPYAGTTGYKAVGGQFDHEAFWEWCREKTREGHTILVSEENAPDDFNCVVHWDFTRGLRGGAECKDTLVRAEKLFTYTP